MHRTPGGLWVPDPLDHVRCQRPSHLRNDTRGQFIARVSTGGGGGGGSAGADLFATGWENAPSTGCSYENLTDNVTFANDYGPSSTCTDSPPIAEVVADEKYSGAKALRVRFGPGYGTNGPDFRIPWVDGTTNHGPDIYIRVMRKYDANWYFRQSDCKNIIFGGFHDGSFGLTSYQDYYFQTRGNAGNTTARVIVWDSQVDSMWYGTNITISRGVWQRWECHVHYGSGTSGYFEARIDGTPVTWAHEAGNVFNVTTGYDNSAMLGMHMCKIDTTYNVYDDAAVQAATPMYSWWDDFAAGTTGWIGAP